MLYHIVNNLDLQCDPDRTDMSIHTNYQFLSSPEKVQRLKSLHAAYCAEHQKVIQLNQPVEKLMEREELKLMRDYMIIP